MYIISIQKEEGNTTWGSHNLQWSDPPKSRSRSLFGD